MEQKKIITLNISTGVYKDFITNIIQLAKARTSSYVCVANVHMLVEAHKDEDFANIVNSADIITPDGMPIAKAFIPLYKTNQNRVAGMTLLPDLLRQAEQDGLGVFFYGGTDEMLNVTKEYCAQHYPNLIISGAYSPPFRPLTPQENLEVVQMINGGGSQLVFVALGCPKQEKWMAAMKGKVNACMVGIGGALPVMVGLQKRAPRWMQKASLEWLYRLGQEPGRLFKRYAVTNSIFMYLLLKTMLNNIVSQRGN
jgi:N-acetylglucosaminyldiphosphoundecaprenol N-acetyl-beta-D-mannosaminyltransferase